MGIASMSGHTTWLGGMEIDEEGDWVWSDGSDWDWEHSERGEGELKSDKCLTVLGSDTWKDANCQSGLSTEFICKYKLTEQGCPTFWSAFGSNCYRLFETDLSWRDAENYCQGEGGHLASVHSQEENYFVSSLSSQSFWLGGTETRGAWAWSDETVWTDWSDGEPDHAGTGTEI